MPKTPSYPVPALEKGLDILETLAAAAVPQSLTDLGQHLERSSSELFRMLNCLERRGFVAREAVSGKYALTLKLFTLAHAHSVIDKLLEAALVPMRHLTESVRESCHLSILERGSLTVVAQQESPERVRLSIEVGSMFDPTHTASGRLLLAYIKDSPEALRRAGIKSVPDEMEGSLGTIRKQGITIAESETIEGVRDVAVLVGNTDSEIVAALAVTRLLKKGKRGDEAAILAALREAAKEITETLGLRYDL